MLSFSNQPKSTSKNQLQEFQFQPMTITNQLPRQVSPHRQQKKIIKTINQPKAKRVEQTNAARSSSKSITNKAWSSNGTLTGNFDKNMRNNDLAAQERRIKAEERKIKLDDRKDRERSRGDIIENEHSIKKKKIEIEKIKENQIIKLKRQIEQEQREKDRADKLYQHKKSQLEKERRELEDIERRIQREGITSTKQLQKEQLFLKRNDVPANDRAHCHQQLRLAKQASSYPQITQSQSTLSQKNQLRQHQLSLLSAQRQRCLQGLPNINYTPSLIPLLSKASYKIISTHISTLTQLLVDDILEEQVYLLEQIELQQRLDKEHRREKDMLQDYYRELDHFVDEAEQIEERVGRYHTMKFDDMYMPKHYPERQYKPSFEHKEHPQPQQLSLNLDYDALEEIENRKDRFKRFVGNFDEYRRENVSMFQRCTEEIINSAIEKLAIELDRGSSDFVEVVFRNQFN